MAAGDVVSGMSAVNTVLNFQPAAGVECVITSVFMSGIANYTYILMHDTASGGDAEAGTFTSPAPMNMKYFINNTRYLKMYAIAGGRTAFTGIQLK